MDEIKLAKLQGTYHKLIKNIQRSSLLILEDFGLSMLPPKIRASVLVGKNLNLVTDYEKKT